MIKARLYRGPANGKIYIVRDNEYHIIFAKMTKDSYKNLGSPEQVGIENYVYRRTNHTHPDGSVFFEWDKPRGTKTK